MNNEINVVVLAAGKGTRMNATDIPKVMYPLNGQPMIGYIADMLEKAAIKDPIVIVGFHGQKVVDYLEKRNGYQFVWQKEQLGTGHALMQAEEKLKNKSGVTVVLNGDNPLFKEETLRRMADQMEQKEAIMAVSSVELDPSFSFGRIVTNQSGHITEIVEVKNATPDQLKISTMNAGLYAFDNNWLWENIHFITLDSISKEFYITDLVAIANKNGDKVITVPVTHPDEAIGINTLENLQSAEEVLSK
jgi:bifunctional UDP-N-acetylglucosamine pyrophosphorylase/glucosamine-1-phosphate N-acetyltransferase